MASKHVPIRTCVGCRKPFAQGDLTRFVRQGSGWNRDTRVRQPGRGAYLCSLACIEKVGKNKRYPGLAHAAAEYGLIRSSEKETTDG